MIDPAARTTFPLSTIHPAWPGVRILTLEGPLRSGHARMRAMLEGAGAAIIAVLTNFDYDGMTEKIAAIELCPSSGEAAQQAKAILATYFDQLSAKHPVMRHDPRPVRPINLMPATGATVPGRVPVLNDGFRLANEALYASVYVRVHIVEQRGDANAISDEILGYEGIRDSLIDYIARLGGYP